MGKERTIMNYPGVTSLLARRPVVLEKIFSQGVNFLVPWPYAIRTVLTEAQQTHTGDEEKRRGHWNNYTCVFSRLQVSAHCGVRSHRHAANDYTYLHSRTTHFAGTTMTAHLRKMTTISSNCISISLYSLANVMEINVLGIVKTTPFANFWSTQIY